MNRLQLLQALDGNQYKHEIVRMIDEGIVFYNFQDNETIEKWYECCVNLISDKQGFYPYFSGCLSQHYHKARNLLFSQAVTDMNLPSHATNEQTPQLQVNEANHKEQIPQTVSSDKNNSEDVDKGSVLPYLVTLGISILLGWFFSYFLPMNFTALLAVVSCVIGSIIALNVCSSRGKIKDYRGFISHISSIKSVYYLNTFAGGIMLMLAILPLTYGGFFNEDAAMFELYCIIIAIVVLVSSFFWYNLATTDSDSSEKEIKGKILKSTIFIGLSALFTIFIFIELLTYRS